MKNNFLILLTFILSATASAQNQCSQLFETTQRDVIENKIQKNMKRYGYEQTGSEIYKKLPNGEKLQIGFVKVIEPKYLYEWADQESYDYWKSNGKYTKSDMNFTLSEPGQSSGRGYYVSTNPIDSESYGTHLTVFKTNGPLFLIDELNRNIYDDAKTLNELRKIGFSGNQGNQQTWLNIFNENVLSEVLPMNQKLFDEIVLTLPKSDNTLLTKSAYETFNEAKIKAITQRIALNTNTVEDLRLIERLMIESATTRTNVKKKLGWFLYLIENSNSNSKVLLDIIYTYLKSTQGKNLNQIELDKLCSLRKTDNHRQLLFTNSYINSVTKKYFIRDFMKISPFYFSLIAYNNGNLVLDLVRENMITLSKSQKKILIANTGYGNNELSPKNKTFFDKYLNEK